MMKTTTSTGNEKYPYGALAMLCSALTYLYANPVVSFFFPHELTLSQSTCFPHLLFLGALTSLSIISNLTHLLSRSVVPY